MVFLFLLVFFLSSRRRHTSFSRDWSSDVCSSDLHRFEPRGHPFVAVEQDVALPRAKELGHSVPLPLEERRAKPETRGKLVGQLDFESDDATRIVVRRIHVRTASFLISAPNELSGLDGRKGFGP